MSIGTFAMGIRSSGTEITNSCELPCGCQELNQGPLEEQSWLLTIEPSFQPQQLVLLRQVA